MTTAKERAPQVWPWRMADGPVLHADRFYAFGDSGGAFVGEVPGAVHGDMMVGGGFATAEACVAACADIYEAPAHLIGTKPEDLGDAGWCVLSGRQYVDRLYYLCEPGGSGWELSDYGHWSAPEKHALPEPEAPAVPPAGARLILRDAAAECLPPELYAQIEAILDGPRGDALARCVSKRLPVTPETAEAVDAEIDRLLALKFARWPEQAGSLLEAYRNRQTLPADWEAVVHKQLRHLLSSRDQGRVMDVLRRVLK